MMQTKWAAILNVLLGNPSLDSVILEDISLKSGANVINHTLGRALQGWRIIRINGAATIYDQQKQNQTPDLTLVVVSNIAVVVSLEVF